MAEEQAQQSENAAEEQATEGAGASGTAVKAAAAAAATGVAALAAKKALSGRGSSNGQSGNGGTDAGAQKASEGPSMLNNVLAGGWEAARDALMPAAEDAARAAGEYVAQNGPDFLRDRIVPRFIESFTEARGET